MMKLKLNKIRIIITVLLFTIEALIAIHLKDGFIRHTFGDFLVVILIYYFFKSFLEISSFKLAIAILLFAFTIEFLQYYSILKQLNLENNKMAILILGSTFQLSDLVAYTLGIISVLIIEFKLQKT